MNCSTRNKLQPDTRIETYFIRTYGRNICIKARGSYRAGDPDPTFPEFVRYLIETSVDQYDEHWEPISLRCRFILKALFIKNMVPPITKFQLILECVSSPINTF